MKKNKFNKIVLVLILLLINTSLLGTPPDGANIGDPSYFGSGCPSDTVSVSLTDDKKSLSLIFDEFIITAGDNTNREFTKKNCVVSIPITVPSGYQVSLLRMDYRGYNDLQCGAQSSLEISYELGSASTNKYKKVFYGPIDGDDYLIRHDLDISQINWSQCGNNTIFTSFINIGVTSNNNMDLSESTIDTNDLVIGDGDDDDDDDNNRRLLKEIIVTQKNKNKSQLRKKRKLGESDNMHTYYLNWQECN